MLLESRPHRHSVGRQKIQEARLLEEIPKLIINKRRRGNHSCLSLGMLLEHANRCRSLLRFLLPSLPKTRLRRLVGFSDSSVPLQQWWLVCSSIRGCRLRHFQDGRRPAQNGATTEHTRRTRPVCNQHGVPMAALASSRIRLCLDVVAACGKWAQLEVRPLDWGSCD